MKTKEEIKSKFVTGAVPTEQDFADFIDSSVLDLTVKEPIPIEKSEGYSYYKNSSGIITLEAYTGTYKTLSPIPVKKGDSIEIYTRFGSSKNAEPISIVDENYTLLESYGTRNETGTFNFDVLSSNAKWLLVTIYHNADTSIIKETSADINDKLKSIDDTTEELDIRLSKIENDGVISPLQGKKIAVIGDSISTINGFNTPSWKVMSIDVGKTIEAWCTYYDIDKVIGGKTITKAMVGTKQSFAPSATDVGKEIGSANNYNAASTKVWSQRLCELAGCELVCNASWSGSQLVKGQGENEDDTAKDSSYVSSYSWSEYTMSRFANNRDSNGNPIIPDVIFIYRGTNDATHTPHGYIGEWDMKSGIPTTDLMDNGNRSYEKAAVILVNKLRTMYPDVVIVFCTLNYFRRGTDLGWTRMFTGGDTLWEYNEGIRSIANKLGCGIVEFDKDGITPYVNPVIYYADGSGSTPTHPNNTGHEVMARKALSDLKYIFEPQS